jgi:RNA polymerase sigma-70 factor (ECF subfamily)
MASTILYMSRSVVDENAEIAAGLRRRDPELLDGLIEQYQHRLLRYLIALTGERALAEVAAQDTWLRVVERGHRYDGRSPFVAWLLTVARNQALDTLRRRRSVSLAALTPGGDAGEPAIPDAGPTPYDLLASRQQQERLAVFVSCLPPLYREVLVLRYHEELSLDQISRLTAAPVSTVKTRLARALRALSPRVEGMR